MKTKTEHTPTPIKPDMTKGGIFPWTKEEKAYIVRAVNSYEALLEAAKHMARYLELNHENGPITHVVHKAIAQAEGGTK